MRGQSQGLEKKNEPVSPSWSFSGVSERLERQGESHCHSAQKAFLQTDEPSVLRNISVGISCKFVLSSYVAYLICNLRIKGC